MISTVKLMRKHATLLMMACCEDDGLYSVLEGGSEPLPERQLRLRLARRLLQLAVMRGIVYRPTGPCIQHLFNRVIPVLAHMSEQRLLQWCHLLYARCQQCLLLQALTVAPAELVARMQLKSLGSGMFTWDVAPLLAVLTESDMEFHLGDPAAVAAWCHQQLCRLPKERPAGLTAELDTPRGRAELLLQPELLLRALSEAVPDRRAVWHIVDEKPMKSWKEEYPLMTTYRECRLLMEPLLRRDLKAWLRLRLPELDGPTVAAAARSWRRRLQRLLSGDRLREAYTSVTGQWPDKWQLRQYVVAPDDGRTGGKFDQWVASAPTLSYRHLDSPSIHMCTYMRPHTYLHAGA